MSTTTRSSSASIVLAFRAAREGAGKRTRYGKQKTFLTSLQALLPLRAILTASQTKTEKLQLSVDEKSGQVVVPTD